MSNSNQFRGGVKSIQRGTISISGTGGATATATISAVNTAKTELRYLGGGGPDNAAAAIFARVALTNSTTITASTTATGSSIPTTIVVSWELTEFF